MLHFKSRLTKKEKENMIVFIKEIEDPYTEFYLTKDNLRLFIKENLSLLFEGLKKGDKIVYDENCKGLAIVVGFSDKADRHYIKFLTKDEKTADDLLQIISWNLSCDLWIKVKKRNPLVNVLKMNGFSFHASRGKEILLVRKNNRNSNSMKEKNNVNRNLSKN